MQWRSINRLAKQYSKHKFQKFKMVEYEAILHSYKGVPIMVRVFHPLAKKRES